MQCSFPDKNCLVARLSRYRPDQLSHEYLMIELGAYQDRHWISVPGSNWDGHWRLHVIGVLYAKRSFDAEEARRASEALRLYKRSFTTLVRQYHSSTGLHDQNKLLEMRQFLILSGRPWHKCLKEGLSTAPIIQEDLPHFDRVYTEGSATLLHLFSPDLLEMPLTDEQCLHLELFFRTSVAHIRKVDGKRHKLGWADILDEWAEGKANRLALVKRLLDRFKLSQCGRVTAAVRRPLLPPPAVPQAVSVGASAAAAAAAAAPPLVSSASARVSASPSRQGARAPHMRQSSDAVGSAALHGRAQRYAAMASEPSRVQPIIPGTLTNREAESSANMLTEQDSLRDFLVERVFEELPDYAIARTDSLINSLKEHLRHSPLNPQKEESADRRKRHSFFKNCLSLLELWHRLEGKLKLSSRTEWKELLSSLFPPQSEPDLHQYLYQMIFFTIFVQRIHASPYNVGQNWYEPICQALSACREDEQEALLVALQRVPLARSVEKIATEPTTAISDFGRVVALRNFTPYQTVALFLHFLTTPPSLERLSCDQHLIWISSLEAYLGMPLSEGVVYSLLAGQPISQKVLTQFNELQNSWRSEVMKPSLLLNKTVVDRTIPMLLLDLDEALVRPQAGSLKDERVRLLDRLRWAALPHDRSYLPALQKFRGLPGGVPSGSVQVMDIAFDRPVNCLANWHYRVDSSGSGRTLGDFECTILLSMEWMSLRRFRVALPIPVNEFFGNSALRDLFHQFVEVLTAESTEHEGDLATPSLRDKQGVTAFLAKVNHPPLTSAFEAYIAATDEDARLQKVISLLAFIEELKIRYRQVAYAFVDEAKTIAGVRLRYPYEKLDVLEDNSGWNRGLLWEQCDAFAQRVYRLQTEGRTGPEILAHGDLVIHFTIISAENAIIILKVEALAELTSISNRTIRYPATCSEAQAKSLFILLLGLANMDYIRKQSI